jgi:hypothetical protein
MATRTAPLVQTALFLLLRPMFWEGIHRRVGGRLGDVW